MRTILLLITSLISLGFAALAYLAFNGQMAITVYIVISLIASISLTFLSGHLLYDYLVQKKHTKKHTK